jgi:hypothetical protein
MSARRTGRPSEDRVFETHPAFAQERRARHLQRLRQPFRRRALLVQLGAFLLVLIIWKIPIINPVKLLVVLFHELSHVLAAYATGGVVFGIAVDPGGAGVTLGMGGDPVVIALAGYTGSLLIGALLCMLTAVWAPDEVWGVLLLLSLLSLAFGWLTELSAVFGIGTVMAMFFVPLVFSDAGQGFLLRLVATASCLYPVIDVAGEYFQAQAEGFNVRGQAVGSDVAELARLTGLPAGVLALAWAAAGLAVLAFVVAWTARKEADVAVKRSFLRRRRRTFEYKRYDPTRPGDAPEYVLR